MLQHDKADSGCAPWSVQNSFDTEAECMSQAAQMFIASRVAQVLAEQSGCLRTSKLIKLLAADFDLPDEMGYDARKLFGFLGCWSDDFVLVPGPPGIADAKDAGIGLRSWLSSFDGLPEHDSWMQQADWGCGTAWQLSWDVLSSWHSDCFAIGLADCSVAVKPDPSLDTLSACSTAAQTPCVAPDSSPPVLPQDLITELGLPEADVG
eukprot:CAMPEP_0204266220 /NCGR_PEP_ID=MMETSP0468-20130131/10192_1 /ASSEMBLY_ACC=CAM_ASM_000383 /TAXON_ID=2969 /ORGANISM="Oxyrrhis marina" /LENGTH=206 /DNA_ID=CAMNT_0051241263 /DNA_START=52 /DNA_END=672 /DNA_ORIENTATION=+